MDNISCVLGITFAYNDWHYVWYWGLLETKWVGCVSVIIKGNESREVLKGTTYEMHMTKRPLTNVLMNFQTNNDCGCLIAYLYLLDFPW